jgi:hypothetical protein
MLRSVPVVGDRITRRLQSEPDQPRVAPAVRELTTQFEELRASDAPVVIGPWVGEVGYELLYWIPFLNWAVGEHGLDRRRLIVVSRGGARHWYRHLTRDYVDVFQLFSLDEYRNASAARWEKAGHQKQYRVEHMDLDIIERAKRLLGIERVALLHPSLMYNLLRLYWFEKAGVALLKAHSEYRSFAPVDRSEQLKHLPDEYVAARFYFRSSFPDTPENRQFAANTVRSLSRTVPVVLLNTGIRPDDHEDLDVSGGGIYQVKRLMTLERNLEVQTEIVSRARAFVGTYGGLAYLGPFYGVPSISFYSDDAELIPAHLDTSWRLGRAMGVRIASLHTQTVELLNLSFAAAPVERAPDLT